MRTLDTHINLPPGVPPTEQVREFFRLAFEEFRWFKPMRYGRFGLDNRLDPNRADYEALVAYYEEYKSITVAARTDRDFLLVFPAKRADEPPHAGAITWCTSAVEAKKPAWRAAHLQQVRQVMRLVGSPYAYAGVEEDLKRKETREVPILDGFAHEEVCTVRDHSEGLAGLFWRNFLGPPFVRLFGERLATLPADTRQALGDGLVLVQPYELPTQAETPEGEGRERELIAHLGPECFYDHARHLKPTRVPELGT